MRLVVERCDAAALETLAPVLESIRTSRDNDEAAENIFRFHHELAVLSGNVLMPLLYHSFRPQKKTGTHAASVSYKTALRIIKKGPLWAFEKEKPPPCNHSSHTARKKAAARCSLQ